MRRFQLAALALVLAGFWMAGAIRGQDNSGPLGPAAYGPVYASVYQEESRWQRFWRSTRRDTQRNAFWFDSFVPAERASVRNPLALQVANGWRLQNTIDYHYFEEDSARLNTAGEDKIRNILELTEQQEEFRAIFVQRASTPELTVARIAAVQEAVRRNVPGGEEVPVLETSRTLRGWPAQYVDDIDSRFRESTPDPRVPPYTRSDSGGGASAGS